ncbi:MAG: hypothetical protein KA715_01660 [Xanthomonadaceae bacterium]|nr:hypothetical protein [Xanthomonadaceae bacterium]
MQSQEQTQPIRLTDEQLIKQINAAFVNSHAHGQKESSAQELQRILTSPALGAILRSIRILASEEGITEMVAAENVVDAMQSLDSIWTQYLIQEGLARIKQV